MRALGTETVIAVLGPAPSGVQREEARGVARLIETGLPLDWTAENEPAVARAAQELSVLASRIGADLVQLHAPAFAGLARWPAPVVSVAHSCLGTWWSAVRGTDLPDDFVWRVAATANGLRASDAVIAPSRAFAAGAPAPSTARTSRSRRSTTAAAHHPRRARRRELAVLTVGRLWDDGKNFAALDRVAGGLHAPVYAAGPTEGPNGAAVRFDNLRLLGELDETTLQARYDGNCGVRLARAL